jgi:hypothetical protein
MRNLYEFELARVGGGCSPTPCECPTPEPTPTKTKNNNGYGNGPESGPPPGRSGDRNPQLTTEGSPDAFKNAGPRGER